MTSFAMLPGTGFLPFLAGLLFVGLLEAAQMPSRPDLPELELSELSTDQRQDKGKATNHISSGDIEGIFDAQGEVSFQMQKVSDAEGDFSSRFDASTAMFVDFDRTPAAAEAAPNAAASGSADAGSEDQEDDSDEDGDWVEDADATENGAEDKLESMLGFANGHASLYDDNKTADCDPDAYRSALEEGWGFFYDALKFKCQGIVPSNVDKVRNAFKSGAWTTYDEADNVTTATYLPKDVKANLVVAVTRFAKEHQLRQLDAQTIANDPQMSTNLWRVPMRSSQLVWAGQRAPRQDSPLEMLFQNCRRVRDMLLYPLVAGTARTFGRKDFAEWLIPPPPTPKKRWRKVIKTTTTIPLPNKGKVFAETHDVEFFKFDEDEEPEEKPKTAEELELDRHSLALDDEDDSDSTGQGCSAKWGKFSDLRRAKRMDRTALNDVDYSTPVKFNLTLLEKQLYVNLEHEFVFCSIPKNGCSAWAHIFDKLEHNDIELYSSPPPYALGQKTIDAAGIENLNKVFANPNATRAVFLRDPLSRFASAFLDKCTAHLKNCFDEGAGDDAPTMRDAIRWAADFNGLAKANEHWRLQSEFCGLREYVHLYTVIGQIHKDTYGGDAQCILEMANLTAYNIIGNNIQGRKPAGLKEVQRSTPIFGSSDQYVMNQKPGISTDEKEEAVLKKLFTTETAKLLIDGPLKADYELFGFPMPTWIDQATGEWLDLVPNMFADSLKTIQLDGQRDKDQQVKERSLLQRNWGVDSSPPASGQWTILDEHDDLVALANAAGFHQETSSI